MSIKTTVMQFIQECKTKVHRKKNRTHLHSHFRRKPLKPLSSFAYCSLLFAIGAFLLIPDAKGSTFLPSQDRFAPHILRSLYIDHSNFIPNPEERFKTSGEPSKKTNFHYAPDYFIDWVAIDLVGEHSTTIEVEEENHLLDYMGDFYNVSPQDLQNLSNSYAKKIAGNCGEYDSISLRALAFDITRTQVLAEENGNFLYLVPYYVDLDYSKDLSFQPVENSNPIDLSDLLYNGRRQIAGYLKLECEESPAQGRPCYQPIQMSHHSVRMTHAKLFEPIKDRGMDIVAYIKSFWTGKESCAIHSDSQDFLAQYVVQLHMAKYFLSEMGQSAVSKALIQFSHLMNDPKFNQIP